MAGVDDSADFLLALTVVAFRSGDGPVRLHVGRTDAPGDYGYLSPAELGKLLEALASSADTATPTSQERVADPEALGGSWPASLSEEGC